MSRFFKSSIGKKLIMSVSGLFLVLFLFVHLIINSFLLVPDEGRLFNAAAHFMMSNPVIKVIEPILAAGFIIHIIWGVVLTLQNRKARGKEKYVSGAKTKNVSWASKNMLILGLAIFAFLILHLSHFYLKMKFTGSELISSIYIDIAGLIVKVDDNYALLNYKFSFLWVVIVYVFAGFCLALHLSHGVWSGFQSAGFSNQIWLKRLKKMAIVFAWIVGIGFSAIATGQYLFF